MNFYDNVDEIECPKAKEIIKEAFFYQDLIHCALNNYFLETTKKQPFYNPYKKIQYEREAINEYDFICSYTIGKEYPIKDFHFVANGWCDFTFAMYGKFALNKDLTIQHASTSVYVTGGPTNNTNHTNHRLYHTFSPFLKDFGNDEYMRVAIAVEKALKESELREKAEKYLKEAEQFLKTTNNYRENT